ncbi:murein biosynthesis integral membrane protein MurJ [Alterisphingorhabdus coralli]|uniref:Probable lipid II flippase MurJ n=1 Tax=Alterisphingorhabdus coralli TaxID=3071408 RepID=A0AA97HZS7_9SPHN|nr:murein biosynthesis integral membrane protein MurJ [Parasphingorhabdus sp. SCSIO 66989]WOE75049.1 murein biosynthesis integral membrane protein MurJ [Parasphingorhabdus sp. SCSIO 66989]
MNLLKATGTIGGLTLVSRFFGFARDILLARILGAGLAADAWQLAFQMPNIFRRLFAEGAFSAAFVPLFNRRLHGSKADDGDEADEDADNAKGHAAAQAFVTDIVSILVPVLLLFSAIFMIAMPGIIWLIAGDFSGGDEAGQKAALSATLARIAFPYLAFMSITTLLAGILNSLSRFAAAAAAPILLNICLVIALIAGALSGAGEDMTVRTAYYLAFAVSISGLLQMLWLAYWVRKSGFSVRIGRPRLNDNVRELGVLIFPAIFGAGIYQISRFVDLFFVARLPEGSLTYLAMADRLNQLPLGIIGIALGTAILPALSRLIASDDPDGASRLQTNAIELSMLLTIPAAFALYVASWPVAGAFYVGGNFTDEDGLTTAAVISALVIGLPAYVLVKVLVPGFFARKDTRTPVVTAGISLAINITLNLLLIPIYGIVGLALAGAISAWCNTAMLYSVLHYRGHYRLPLILLLRLARIALAATLMALAMIYVIPYGLVFFTGSTIERIVSLALLVLVGLIVYALAAWFGGAVDKERIKLLTSRKSANATTTDTAE